MHDTTDVLQQMASIVALHGVHTGNQFAVRTHQDRLTQHDICALAWVIAEGRIAPREFFTDEVASLALIESSARAMAAIRAISDVLDSAICETEVEPGTWVPDYIEHVSNWAATPCPVAPKLPPTVDEVIGRILRAANHAATQTPAA